MRQLARLKEGLCGEGKAGSLEEDETLGKHKKIEIIIKKDGTFSSESHGVTGEECIDILQELLGELADIEEFTPKRGYYDDPSKAKRKRKAKRQRRQGVG